MSNESRVIPSVLATRRRATRVKSEYPFLAVAENPQKSLEAQQLAILFDGDYRAKASLFGEVWVNSWPKSEVRELDPDTEYQLGEIGKTYEIGYERWNVSDTIEDAILSRDTVYDKYRRGEGEEVVRLLGLIDFIKDFKRRVANGEVTKDTLPQFREEGFRILESSGYVNVQKDSRKKIRDGFKNIITLDAKDRLNTPSMELKAGHVWHDAIEELAFFLNPESKNLAIKLKLLDLRGVIKSDFENLNTMMTNAINFSGSPSDFYGLVRNLQAFASDRLSASRIMVRPYTHMASYTRVLLVKSEPIDQIHLPYFEQGEADNIFANAISRDMDIFDIKSRLKQLEAQNRNWLREADKVLGLGTAPVGPRLY